MTGPQCVCEQVIRSLSRGSFVFFSTCLETATASEARDADEVGRHHDQTVAVGVFDGQRLGRTGHAPCPRMGFLRLA